MKATLITALWVVGGVILGAMVRGYTDGSKIKQTTDTGGQ